MRGLLYPFLLLALFLTGCRGGNPAADTLAPGDTVTHRSSLLTIVKHPGWVEAKVTDPWKPGSYLARYALVSGDSDITLPNGYTAITIPLKRSIVYSSVHTSAISELEASNAIAAVADGSYLPDTDPLYTKLADGEIRDIGSSMSPSIETAIDIEPDAILLCPYENGSLGGIEKIGVPLVQMADYMEMNPTGRAEWILLLGYLYGRPDRAKEIYSEVCNSYDSIAAAASARVHRPRVFTERLTSGVWYVPGGKSYMARLIADAGGDYLWADTNASGSIPLDEAAVIDRAADADFWLLKEFEPMTVERLRAEMPRAMSFRAFPGGVRVCDTRHTSLFNDLAFHPERVLADLSATFAGDPSTPTKYFKPLQ